MSTLAPAPHPPHELAAPQSRVDLVSQRQAADNQAAQQEQFARIAASYRAHQAEAAREKAAQSSGDTASVTAGSATALTSDPTASTAQTDRTKTQSTDGGQDETASMPPGHGGYVPSDADRAAVVARMLAQRAPQAVQANTAEARHPGVTSAGSRDDRQAMVHFQPADKTVNATENKTDAPSPAPSIASQTLDVGIVTQGTQSPPSEANSASNADTETSPLSQKVKERLRRWSNEAKTRVSSGSRSARKRSLEALKLRLQAQETQTTALLQERSELQQILQTQAAQHEKQMQALRDTVSTFQSNITDTLKAQTFETINGLKDQVKDLAAQLERAQATQSAGDPSTLATGATGLGSTMGTVARIPPFVGRPPVYRQPLPTGYTAASRLPMNFPNSTLHPAQDHLMRQQMFGRPQPTFAAYSPRAQITAHPYVMQSLMPPSASFYADFQNPNYIQHVRRPSMPSTHMPSAFYPSTASPFSRLPVGSFRDGTAIDLEGSSILKKLNEELMSRQPGEIKMAEIAFDDGRSKITGKAYTVTDDLLGPIGMRTNTIPVSTFEALSTQSSDTQSMAMRTGGF